jgi:hypothetical protein
VVLLGLSPPAGEAYAVIARVIELAPVHIRAQIVFDDGSNKPTRYTLWNGHKTNKAPTWQISDPPWNPTRILLPARKFSASPLGDLVTLTQRNAMLMLEKRGLDWLKLESYDSYASYGIIHCPHLDCSSTFPDRKLWNDHLRDSEHGPGYGYRGEALYA